MGAHLGVFSRTPACEAGAGAAACRASGPQLGDAAASFSVPHLIARQQAVAGFVCWGLHRGRVPTVRAGVHASRHLLSFPLLRIQVICFSYGNATGRLEEADVCGSGRTQCGVLKAQGQWAACGAVRCGALFGIPELFAYQRGARAV